LFQQSLLQAFWVRVMVIRLVPFQRKIKLLATEFCLVHNWDLQLVFKERDEGTDGLSEPGYSAIAEDGSR